MYKRQHLRKAEVLADENQAGPVGIANPQGLEWTEKGLKLNALTAVVLRLSQGGAIVAPAVEEKPEFNLSSLDVEPEQGQAQNLAANPETQETVAEAHSQNLLPNTGTESKSLLVLAGFSIDVYKRQLFPAQGSVRSTFPVSTPIKRMVKGSVASITLVSSPIFL